MVERKSGQPLARAYWKHELAKPRIDCKPPDRQAGRRRRAGRVRGAHRQDDGWELDVLRSTACLLLLLVKSEQWTDLLGVVHGLSDAGALEVVHVPRLLVRAVLGREHHLELARLVHHEVRRLVLRTTTRLREEAISRRESDHPYFNREH